MAARVLTIESIVSDPQVRGGRPVIAGTTLRVSDVALASRADLSPEAIAERYGLDPGQVHAALAYYHLHRAEIDAEIQRDDEAGERWVGDLEKQGRLIRLD
jgi:uncharacterized protein (DUF433 family)